MYACTPLKQVVSLIVGFIHRRVVGFIHRCVKFSYKVVLTCLVQRVVGLPHSCVVYTLLSCQWLCSGVNSAVAIVLQLGQV